MFVDWGKKYGVGVQTFDTHHMHLFELMNNLADAITCNKESLKKKEILEELGDYSLIHLDAEEKAMEAHGYPDYENHKKEHMVMRNRIAEFHEQQASETIALSALLDFIADWWTTHITKTDRRYSSFFNEKGLK